MACFSLWKDKKQCVEKGKQISALVHSDQLQKIAISNQLPVRGKLDAFDDMSEVGSRLFLSVVDVNIRKDPHLAQISLVIHFVSEETVEIMEQLLVIATATSRDAQSITDIILSEVTKAGLSLTRILSQV